MTVGHSRHRFIGAVLAVVLFALPSVAHADPSTTTIEQGYDLGEIQQPRAIAMGGAQQAFGGSTNALYANPANLPLYRVYHIEAVAAFAPEARRQSYGGAIVDSSTSRLAGGFGGMWSQMDPDGIKRQFADLRLTLAYPLGDRLSAGVTGRYLRVAQRTGAGPLGASQASDGSSGDPIFSQFTFDAGLAASVTENIRVGVSGRNLTAPGTPLAPVGLAAGAGYSNGTFTIEGDELIDFTTWSQTRGRTMVGAEVFLADRFPVRAGYRYDDGTKTHGVGLGVGYVDKQFSLEIGGRRDVVGEHPATFIGVGLRFFIAGSNSSGGEPVGMDL